MKHLHFAPGLVPNMRQPEHDDERVRRLEEFLKATKPQIAERDDKGSLADRFYASTYELPRVLQRSGAGRARDYEQCMLRYRSAIRRANLFSLTNEFVETVTRVSSSTLPDKLMRRIPLAVLPFQTTWIEFNLREKVRTTQSMGLGDGDPDLSDVPEMMGMLLERDHERSTRFKLTCTGPLTLAKNAKDPTLSHAVGVEGPHMLTYNVDIADGAVVESGRLMQFENTLSSRRFRALPWGYTISQKHATWAPFDEAPDVGAPEELTNHCGLDYSYLFRVVGLHISDESTRALVNHVVDEAVSQMGTVRWVITLLAMLSDVPLYASEKKEPPGHHRVGTQTKPFMDYHRLSIKLPKLHAIKYVERRLDKIERAKKRAHEVRTHWRTYLVENHCTRDTHSWEYSEDGEHRTCSRCASHGTLIKEHVRGDEKLGWVRKDYVLETNRRV